MTFFLKKLGTIMFSDTEGHTDIYIWTKKLLDTQSYWNM